MNKLVLFFLFFCISLSVFSEELDLSIEDNAKKYFVGKSLNCWMHEDNYKGPISIETTSIKGKKFKGKSEAWCHQQLLWTGKFKKDRMKISQQGISAQTCYCRNGFLKFKKNSDGVLTGEGKYKVGCGATPFEGELKCKVE